MDREPEGFTIEVIGDRRRGSNRLAMNDLISEREPRQQTEQREK
jgi:hypothetical protein